MSNLYCDLSAFKTRLNITGSGDDALLLTLLEHTSRAVDQFCNRFFYVKSETRYYDGTASPLLLEQDLVAVTSLKTDDNGSGDWETTWVTADYELLPYSDWPKHAISVTPWGSKRDFNQGLKKSVEVAAKWGYREETEDSGADINEVYTATDLTLTVTDGTKFRVGQTILIEAEQLSLSGISTNDLTVKRGANGTAAAAHPNSTDISIFRYPRPIVEACLLQAARLWRRKDSAYGSLLRPADEGQVSILQGLDSDVELLVSPYRKVSLKAV